MGNINPQHEIVKQFLEYGTSVLQASEFDNLKSKKYSRPIYPEYLNFIHMFIDLHKMAMNNMNMLTNGCRTKGEG